MRQFRKRKAEDGQVAILVYVNKPAASFLEQMALSGGQSRAEVVADLVMDGIWTVKQLQVLSAKLISEGVAADEVERFCMDRITLLRRELASPDLVAALKDWTVASEH